MYILCKSGIVSIVVTGTTIIFFLSGAGVGATDKHRGASDRYGRIENRPVTGHRSNTVTVNTHRTIDCVIDCGVDVNTHATVFAITRRISTQICRRDVKCICETLRLCGVQALRRDAGINFMTNDCDSLAVFIDERGGDCVVFNREEGRRILRKYRCSADEQDAQTQKNRQ